MCDVKKYIISNLETSIKIEDLSDNFKGENRDLEKILEIYNGDTFTIYYEDSSDIIDCIICSTEREVKKFKVFNCGHRICKKCSLNLRDVLCPICRKDITEDYGQYQLKIIRNRKKLDADERKKIELEESEKLARTLATNDNQSFWRSNDSGISSTYNQRRLYEYVNSDMIERLMDNLDVVTPGNWNFSMSTYPLRKMETSEELTSSE